MKNKIRVGAVVLSILFAATVQAQAPTEVPGVVPLYAGQAPAVDLVDENGQESFPEDLHAKWQSSNGSYDLSLLNPKADTDLWRDEFPQRLDPALDRLEVDSGNEVTYVAPVSSRSHNFRFGAHLEQNGAKKLFTFQVTRYSTNLLLRKALLRKLGYRVPPAKRLARLKVKFRTPGAKELFVKEIEDKTFMDPLPRWIIEEESSDDTVVLQDVLVLVDQPQSYALYNGYIPRGSVKDRRLLRSLLIPYELIFVPETVNQMPWQFGQVVSNHLRMSPSFREAGEFDGNYDDARWITRRILKLSRADWVEIVAATDTPTPVQKLLVEKLISRRNDLAKVLKLEGAELAFDSKVSDGQYLKGGKLSYETTTDDKGNVSVKPWDGYGQRFAFGDPEAPLSNSDILSFAGSKALANLLSNLVSQFNEHIMPRTDLEKEVLDLQTKKAQERFTEFLKTGKMDEVKFGAWVIPTFGVNLIAARDIVIGSYLGTDNVVQLADAIGVSANVGAYIGFDGIPVPWHAAVQAGGAVTRTYTHLRPLKTIKSALKYPFKNILVPLLKGEYGDLLNEITAENLDKIEDDGERKQQLTKLVNVFKDQLQIGESILITDTIGAKLDVQAGYKFSDVVKAYANFNTQQLVLSRLHIHRFSDNTIHVYRDLGNVGSVQIALTLDAAIPIITVSSQYSAGNARTKFFSLDISPVIQDNPDLYRNVEVLRQVLKSNSLEYLSVLQKPYILRYKFDQGVDRLNLLHFRWAWLRSGTKIEVEKPETDRRRTFYRKVTSRMEGKNYEELALDALNYAIEEATDIGVFVSNTATGRPSNSIFGSSLVRSVTVDGETSAVSNGENVRVDDFFVKLTYNWAGWSISKEDAQRILDDINNRNHLQLYAPQVLNETSKIQFYNIELYYNFYDAGIRHMLSLNKEQLRAIFERHKVKGLSRVKVEHRGKRTVITRDNIVDDFLKVRQFFANRYEKGELDTYFGHMNKMISIIEAYVSKDGLMEMFGGEQNLLIGSRVSGFRFNDESGDQPYFSHTAGEFGSRQFEGPLDDMQNTMGISKGEFFLYWLLERL